MSDETDLDKARAEIAATRTALAETTAALKVKTDVKTRATEALKAHQSVIVAVGGGVALVVVIRTWARKKSTNTKRKKR